MVLRGNSGREYELHSSPFTGGGEGAIYHIKGFPAYVAKLYKSEHDMDERERKLKVMLARPPKIPEQYAWPVDLLYDGSRFVGFVMPKVVGKEKLSDIFSVEDDKKKDWRFYITVAKNLAAAISNVHEIDHVIGDLNPKNVMVDPRTGLVTLVDTDSYHITDGNRVYRCKVGKDDHIPAELQGIHFASAKLPTFTKETDRFALSVLIFETLMNGVHPFSCRVIGGSSSYFQPLENIKNCICAFFPESRTANMDIPISAPDMGALPPLMQQLFRRAFIGGHKNPSQRPAAEEWYRALEQLESNLTNCQNNVSHKYYQGTGSCPWCEVERKRQAAAQKIRNKSNAGIGGQSAGAPGGGAGNAGGTGNAGNTGGTGGTGGPGNTGNTGNTGNGGRYSGFTHLILNVLAVVYTIFSLLFALIRKTWKWLLGIGSVIFVIVLLFRGCGGTDENDVNAPESPPYGQIQDFEPSEEQPASEESSEEEPSEEEPSGEQPASEETTEEVPVEPGTGKGRPSADVRHKGKHFVITDTDILQTKREIEPNDFPAWADPIEPGKKYVGSLSGKRDKEQDWYTFTLKEPGIVSFDAYTKKQFSLRAYNPFWEFRLFREDAQSYLLYELMDHDETELHSEEVTLNAGTYYFRVQSGKRKYSKDDYTFVINYTEKTDYEVEPNDRMSSATKFRVNAPITGKLGKGDSIYNNEEDWYVFTCPAAGIFRVRLDTPEQEADYQSYWDLSVRSAADPDEELWSGKWIYGDAKETLLPYIGVSKGDTYYVCVYGGWLSGIGEYTLEIEFEETDEWETEPNNSYETATPLQLGEVRHGAVSSGRYNYEQDWYSFTLEEPATIALDFDISGENLKYKCWDVSIRDAEDPTKDIWQEYVSGSVRSENLTLEPGTYYVELEATSHWSSKPYTVSVKVQ